MVIDPKTALLIRNLDIVAEENGISKAYSVFLCSEKEFSQVTVDLGQSEADARKQHESHAMEQAKTKVNIPTSCHDMIDYLVNFEGLTKMIFGDKTEILGLITGWIEFCKENKGSIQQQAFSDKEIFAKVLTTVDNRVQAFLECCRDAKTVDKIDYSVFDGSADKATIKSKLLLPVILNPLVRALTHAKMAPNKTGDDGSIKSPPNKRQKKEELGQGTPIKNENVDRELKKHFNRHYSKIMAEQDSTPVWEGTPLCVRYHCSGFCRKGEKCEKGESHCKLPAEKIKELREWVEASSGTIGSGSTRKKSKVSFKSEKEETA
jgi:hypothetical protein